MERRNIKESKLVRNVRLSVEKNPYQNNYLFTNGCWSDYGGKGIHRWKVFERNNEQIECLKCNQCGIVQEIDSDYLKKCLKQFEGFRKI